MNHHQARRLAEQFILAMALHCERIEIAGSLHRLVNDVKDIEIVCLVSTSEYISRNMFGEEIGRELINKTFAVLPEIMAATDWQIGEKDGPAYKQLLHNTFNIKLDLFTVSEARRWGACYVIRTGPREFNIELMKYINRHGQHIRNNLLHGHAKMWIKTPRGPEGLPCEKGDACPLIIPTPTEGAFFRAVNLPEVSPDLRSVEWLKKAVSQRIRDKSKRR